MLFNNLILLESYTFPERSISSGFHPVFIRFSSGFHPVFRQVEVGDILEEMDGVSLFAFSPEGIAKMVKKAAGKLPIRFCQKSFDFTLCVKLILSLYLKVLRHKTTYISLIKFISCVTSNCGHTCKLQTLKV